MATKKIKKPVMGRMPGELFEKLISGSGVGAHRTRRNQPQRKKKHKKDLRHSD